DDPAQALAMCALEFALLQCRKRRAIEDEDFDLAQQAKACGADVAARAAAARARCPGAPAPAGDATAELDAVRAEKRAAVEAEEPARAASALGGHGERGRSCGPRVPAAAMATPGQLQMYNKMEVGEMFGLDHRAEPDIYPDEKVPDACVFHIWLEDHTLGNILRMELLRNEAVLFAGYKVPHPLNHMIELRVQTLPKTTPEAAVRHAVANLRSECRSMLDQFDSQVKDLEARAAKDAVPTGALLDEDRLHTTDAELTGAEGTTSGPEPEAPYSPYSPGVDDRDQRFQEQLEEFERLAGGQDSDAA
ncbi:unnamed protein product, partial [Prorocentrum cordatum]